MGAKTALTVEEYLHTSFPDLDKEYRDGELVERTLPTYPHSKTQLVLGAYFIVLGRTQPVFPASELRLKVREGLYRIPGVSVFYPTEPADPVPDKPPPIVIEILSPDHRVPGVLKKLGEY